MNYSDFMPHSLRTVFFGAHYFMEFEKVERCYGLQRASGVINDSNVLSNLNIENKMRF